MIQRLSTMTEEQRLQYMDYYENIMLTGKLGAKLMKPNAEFDEFGLKFSEEYLAMVGKNIVLLPLELMAEYVDMVTKVLIDENNEKFIFEQIIDRNVNIDELWDSINATSLGNLAYICIYCKNLKAIENTEKLLNDIFVKQKGILLNAMNEIL